MKGSRVLWVFFLFFFFRSMSAQILWELKLDPKPYLSVQPYDKIVTTPIKQVIHINEVTKDTISIRQYSKDKMLNLEVSFIGGRRSSVYAYSYDKNLEYVTNETHHNQNSIPQSRTTYGVKGNIKEIYNYSLFGKDTVVTYKQRGIFEYDKQDKLTKVLNVYNKDTISVNEYFYEDKHMVKSKMFQHPLKKSVTEYRLKYNEDELPIEIDVYNVSDKGVILESYNHYAYSKKQLIHEEYTAFGKPDVIVRIDYSYTIDGDINNILLSANNDTIKVNYRYNDKKQLIHKNSYVTSRNVYKVWIPIFYDRIVKMPFEMKENFIYDHYGNLIEGVQIVEDVIVRKNVFAVEYY